MLKGIFRGRGLHWRNRTTGGFLADRHEKKLLLPRGVAARLKLTFSGGLADVMLRLSLSQDKLLDLVSNL